MADQDTRKGYPYRFEFVTDQDTRKGYPYRFEFVGAPLAGALNTNSVKR
jgi:hypothetical protein